MGAGKKRRRKLEKRLRRKKEVRKRLERRTRKRLGGPVIPVEHEVKASALLLALIEPYLELVTSGKIFRRLVTLAAAAWNLSLMPEEQRQEIMEALLSEMGDAEARENFREIIEGLIRRKEHYFGEYKWIVVGFDVAEEEDEFHLVVASAIPEDEETLLAPLYGAGAASPGEEQEQDEEG